jgi:5-formyltetrahydrofolate cyclo-ligase
MSTTQNPQDLILKESRAEKTALRNRIRALLAAMTPPFRVEASNLVTALLVKQRIWKDAQSVLVYAPLPQELDIWPLVTIALGEGKTVALPRYIPKDKTYVVCPIADPANDLQIGKFGIREPAPHCLSVAISRLDFVMVPGVAFDLHGRRLGRGRGFYDQILKAVSGKTCGIAFDEQIVETVPVEPHDILVKSILTPTRWLEV